MPKKPPGPPPRTAFPRGGRPPEKFAPRAKMTDYSKITKPNAPVRTTAVERPLPRRKRTPADYR